MEDWKPFDDGGTRGFLHTPSERGAGALVLTHGAGANCQSPLVVAVAQAFQRAGYYVLRYDLPFRQRRKSGPPHPSQAAADRDGLRAAVRSLQRVSELPVCLGGHSYGGRQATLLAAEDPTIAERLLLLSYPLHPPAKPTQLRTAHFSNLRTPALFVHGSNDPFGSPAEMDAALELVPAPHALKVVEGAGHDLKRGKLDLDANVVKPFVTLASQPR